MLIRELPSGIIIIFSILVVVAIGGTAMADGSAAQLDRVRIGVHPDKTRVVIDLSTDSDFSYNLDQGAGFHVSFPDINVRTNTFSATGIVNSATFERADNGGHLVIRTMSPIEVINVFRLYPDSYGGHRIVLDIRETMNWEMAELTSTEPQLALSANGLPEQKVRIPEFFWEAIGLKPVVPDEIQYGDKRISINKFRLAEPVAPVPPIQGTIDKFTWETMVLAQEKENKEGQSGSFDWWPF